MKKRIQKKRPEPKPSSSRAGFALGFAALALIAVAMHLGSREGRRFEPTSRRTAAAPVPRAEHYSYRGNPDPEARRQIPWTYLHADGNGFVPVALEKRLGCSQGDFDAMLGDYRRSEHQALLLTLEPLVPGDDFPAQTFALGSAALQRGFQGKLRFPKDGRPRQLGLFLCKDSDQTGRCAAKEAKDLTKLIWENAQELAKEIPTAAPDRIYFFQYLYQDKDGNVHAFRHAPVANEAFRLQREALAGIFEPGRLAAEEKALDRAMELTRTLVSLPLRTEKGYVRLTLPAHDPYRVCGPVAAR